MVGVDRSAVVTCVPRWLVEFESLRRIVGSVERGVKSALGTNS